MVIIRFDYSGATNIVDFVNRIKQEEFMKAAFSKMRPMEQRQISMSVGPKEFYEGRMPLTQRQTSTLYHFYDCLLQEGLEAHLDINSVFTVLVVNINNSYDGSARFTDFMAQILYELHRYDQFITIDRIGIRKIDSQRITNDKCFDYYFNDNYYVVNSWKARPGMNKVNMTEFFSEGKVSFNVTQQIERQHAEDDNVYAIYDIDAYVRNGDLKDLLDDKSKMVEFMDIDMQEKMFRMFESVVTESYLETCYVSKQYEE